MRSARTACIALAALLLAACTSLDEEMASWIGQPREELIATWGVPTAETPDGGGGTILIYETTTSTTSRPFATYHHHDKRHIYVDEGPEYTRYGRSVRSFFLDEDGVIYDYRWGER